MDYKQIFTVPVLVGTTVISGIAGIGGYAVHTVTQPQDVKIEATLKIDENKLSEKVSEKVASKLIENEKMVASAEDARIKVRACKRNADNEYFVRDHCKGVTF